MDDLKIKSEHFLDVIVEIGVFYVFVFDFVDL